MFKLDFFFLSMYIMQIVRRESVMEGHFRPMNASFFTAASLKKEKMSLLVTAAVDGILLPTLMRKPSRPLNLFPAYERVALQWSVAFKYAEIFCLHSATFQLARWSMTRMCCPSHLHSRKEDGSSQAPPSGVIWRLRTSNLLTSQHHTSHVWYTSQSCRFDWL